jgi:Flp pilus assembly protein protease CpaA
MGKGRRMKEHLKNLLGGGGAIFFATPSFWHGLNEALQFISLLVGIGIGLLTLRRMWKQHRGK